MRRFVLPIVLIVLAAATAPGAMAAPGSPFTGAWMGHDPAPPDGDGSTLFLSISGGSSPRITFTDLHGSICVNNDAKTSVFSSRLVGSASGHHLEAVFASARCGATRFDWLVGEVMTYHYDEATDTLSDGFAIFHRR